MPTFMNKFLAAFIIGFPAFGVFILVATFVGGPLGIFLGGIIALAVMFAMAYLMEWLKLG